ncbi:hypothetical protein [Nonlabens sp.]|uniref:hypothetical protein n=1 Tax=Nonlabens sp. TaxID=1888209 RepID=UPI0025D71151|nr:hypothetical protein [Nonlabens sp.]
MPVIFTIISHIKTITQLSFGGGCHRRTEAVFQAIEGVEGIDQGLFSSVFHLRIGVKRSLLTLQTK